MTAPAAALNYMSLFSGIGGLDLGLDRAGMTCVAQVEIDEFCQRVLAKHWPEVPRHADVRTAAKWWTGEPFRPRVDVIAGGFPCQPVSEAGLKRAQQDDRWLWPAMAETIAALSPEWVIGENVPGLLDRGIDHVVRDLHRLGYRVRVGTISACAVGAPHARSRVFVLAHSLRSGCEEGRDQPVVGGHRKVESTSTRRGLGTPERSTGWETEPRVDRVAHGVPNRVDRLRALGNAVVPSVGEYVGRLIMARTERVELLNPTPTTTEEVA